MPANDRMPPLWTRRSLLVALAVGSVSALSGCRVRLEEGALQLPLVPARVPMKDEKTLLAVLGRTTRLESLTKAAGRAPTSMTGRLSAIHATQVGVIARLLREGGVPEPLIGASSASPSPTTPRSAPASKVSAARLSAAGLAAAERGSASDISLGDISTAHVALIGSMLAQRTAAVTLLGGRARPGVPSNFKGPEAVRLLAATRAAVYGFEIVAAQIDDTDRALARSTLASLRTRAAKLENLVGPAGTPQPLGYRLPFPVTDAGSARRLALHVLEALLASTAVALGRATGDAAALAALVNWLGATEAVASRWGAPLTAFPGLTNG